MNWMEAALLGTLQGLTEFLPVSSSGHLKMGEHLVGLPKDNLIFDIYLHGITFLVVVVVFWKQVKGLIKDKAMIVALSLSTVATVAVVFGFGMKKIFTTADLQFVMCAELVTALILLLAEGAARRGSKIDFPLWKVAVVVGIAQGFAVLPGISRSGSTIAIALILGWKRDKAFEYAFLVSLPAIAGAMVMMVKDLLSASASNQVVVPDVSVFIAGALPAALFGYLTLIGLRKWVQTSLRPFAYYCLALGIVGLILS